VRGDSLWRTALEVDKTVVEGWEYRRSLGAFVVRVRPYRWQQQRCGICRIPAALYDQGRGRRLWRSLDCGERAVFLEAPAPRVACAAHGVVVAHLPWARHGAGHTRGFDRRVAWLALGMSRSRVQQLMRISWRTVGAIIARVWADTGARVDRFSELRRIAIDEICYRRRAQRYLVVVSDHDTGRPVWIGEGRDKAALEAFFDQLGAERSAAITHVTADGATFIAAAVREHAPQAVLCADRFHVVRWANEALDNSRRMIWNELRDAPGGTVTQTTAGGRSFKRSVGLATAFKQIRFALKKRPENLTRSQRLALDWLAEADPRLYEGHLLKEGLRVIFALPYDLAGLALQTWITDARASGLKPFITLANAIDKKHTTTILASIKHDLSNGLAESVNAGVRQILRQAFGFMNIEALKAMIMFKLAGPEPLLRTQPTHT
jgi:transposase